MKGGSWVLLIVALAGLILLAACSGGPEPAYRGGPRLRAEPAAVDFGTVPARTVVKASFALENMGDSPLNIERGTIKVVEGCCPPEPRLSSSSIEPGKKATLSMEFTMHGDMVGPHLFQVQLYSNDAVSPVTTLEVKGVFLSE